MAADFGGGWVKNEWKIATADKMKGFSSGHSELYCLHLFAITEQISSKVTL